MPRNSVRLSTGRDSTQRVIDYHYLASDLTTRSWYMTTDGNLTWCASVRPENGMRDCKNLTDVLDDRHRKFRDEKYLHWN